MTNFQCLTVYFIGNRRNLFAHRFSTLQFLSSGPQSLRFPWDEKEKQRCVFCSIQHWDRYRMMRQYFQTRVNHQRRTAIEFVSPLNTIFDVCSETAALKRNTKSFFHLDKSDSFPACGRFVVAQFVSLNVLRGFSVTRKKNEAPLTTASNLRAFQKIGIHERG